MARQDTADRHTYSADDALLPELHHVGWTAPRTAGAYGLGSHQHPGWEICWLRRGAVDWWAADHVHHVPAGSCYVTRPDEPHGGLHDRLTPCDLFWLQLAPPRSGRWGGLDRAATTALHQALLDLPHRVFPGDRQLGTLWTDLLGEHRAPDERSALVARALLHQILALVLRCAGRHATRSPAPSPPIARALARAQVHLGQGIGVPALARTAGLSPSRFHARFLAEIGESPADWLRRRRIDRAKQRLATTAMPITTLALDLGFPSSQHFATVFKRYVGLTPQGYRTSVRLAIT